MKLVNRTLKQVRKSLQKGFTLIELAIVGLFLGLLAIFAITQFSGSATNATKANGLYEASTKIADNWALVVQSCGITSDITALDLTTNAAGASAAAHNLDVLLGNATAHTNLTSCVTSSGIRPLNGVATGGAGAQKVQGYGLTAANTTSGGRNVVNLVFASVPETVILPLYNKYSSVSTAAAATALPAAADTSDPAVRFSTATAGARTMTLVKVL